jgi:hypothetical protein
MPTEIYLSGAPRIAFRFGNPALLRWDEESGYLELEIGHVTSESDVVAKLGRFWSGLWDDWSYGEHNDRYTLTLEMERVENVVTLRLDYHHMRDHLGVDRTVVVTRPVAA